MSDDTFLLREERRQSEQLRLLGTAIHVSAEGIAILTPAVESVAKAPPLAVTLARSFADPIVRPPPVRLSVRLPPLPGLSLPNVESASSPFEMSAL